MSVGADGTAMTAVGASLAFLAVIYLGVLAKRQLSPPAAGSSSAQQRRFTRNAIAPVATSLIDRLLFWVFWIIVLRRIGPEGNGAYAFAANLLTYFAAVVDFGLGTLITREVARSPATLGHIFHTALALRARTLTICLPAMVIVALTYWATGSISNDTLLTTGLLALSLPLAAINQAYASVYSAWERMDRRGFVVIGTASLTVGLGLVFLAAGLGVAGIAAAGLVSGFATFVTLARPVGFNLLRRTVGAGDHSTWHLAREALPLMLNSLLATAFIQIDVLILQPLQGTTVVGHYNAAYKFLNALNIVPAAVVLAAFPLMARAVGNSHELGRWFVRSWRVLATTCALSVAFLSIFAEPLIDAILGPQYLPETAVALAILIWFLPFSYLNGTLQYVVIASNRQWWLTPVFLITTLFNIGLNLALVPTWGFVAAAATTIASEGVLLAGLAWITRHERLLIRGIEPMARPILGAIVFAAIAIPLREHGWIVAATAASGAYLLTLVLTGGLPISVLRDMTRTDSQDGE